MGRGVHKHDPCASRILLIRKGLRVLFSLVRRLNMSSSFVFEFPERGGGISKSNPVQATNKNPVFLAVFSATSTVRQEKYLYRECAIQLPWRGLAPTSPHPGLTYFFKHSLLFLPIDKLFRCAPAKLMYVREM